MDEVVLKAMARWPDVPAVYGWLVLDRRGRWLIRGEVIGNRSAREFIGRNYAVDGAGNWYFQNGPQRVYVDLDYTPWVLRRRGDGGLDTHTGIAVTAPRRAYVDREGNLLMAFESGIALVEDRDLEALSRGLRGPGGECLDPDAVMRALSALAAGTGGGMRLHHQSAVLEVEGISSDVVPARFGFNPRPRAPASASE